MAWPLPYRGISNVREHVPIAHLLSTLPLLFPLLLLSACDGGGAGSPKDPAPSPAFPTDEAPDPPVEAGQGEAASEGPGKADWLPGGSDESSAGQRRLAAMSAEPRGEAGDRACDAGCEGGEICDPASGGCVPHCAESPCVTGWSCDGRSGLCVPDRPDCGRCREGQVCDPEVRVCVAHCSWAGCADDAGRCDRETGFCVK